MRSWDLAKVIGLHGKMHTGKSALARSLQEKNPDSVIMSFAGKLRGVLDHLNIPVEREPLQKLGQGLRDVCPDVWVHAIRKDVAEHLDKGTTVIFDDLRYPNEFDFVKSHDGLLVKLVADTNIRWDRYKDSSKFDPTLTRDMWNSRQEHISEILLDDKPLDWTVIIDTNDLSKKDMTTVAATLALTIQAVK
jgi:hypothetical protein